MASPVSDEPQGRLKPTLGLFTAVTLIIGSMIGSGIFRLPANMMGFVQNPTLLVLVWVAGGLMTISGALTIAELAGMFPRAGGMYQFIKEGVGRPFAFLYGWSFFWIVQTGIIAAVALVFAEFTRRLFGFSGLWVPSVAVACILLLSVVNYLGAKSGGRVQDIFTVAKVAGLVTLIVAGFLVGHPTHDMFGTVAGAPSGLGAVSAFFSALLLGLFAMDGWPQAAYVAPEIKNPTRNVPKAMIFGVLTVVTLYVLATLAYVYLLPTADILGINASGGRQVIAAEAAKAFSGEIGAKLISAAVMISTFGTVNAFVLTSPRIYYAVAHDGMFPQRFRIINAKTNVPTFAIAVQGTWAGLLVCVARFAPDAYGALTNAVSFVIWLFYLPAVVGYFILRRRRPDAPRPYRTHFYPIVPAFFLLSGIVVVGNNLIVDLVKVAGGGLTGSEVAGLTGIWGTVVTLLGLPFILVWRSRARRGEASPLSASTLVAATPARDA